MKLTARRALVAFTILATCAQAATPVFWLHPNGQILISGHVANAEFVDKVTTFRTLVGVSYDFSASHAVIKLQDPPELRLTGSLTISAWIFPRRYHVHGNGSQILFRGDDRPGLDPYYLRLEGDGQVHFAIYDAENKRAEVKFPVPLNRWTHVTGSFDAKIGKIDLWLDGKLVSSRTTAIRPFADLDPNSAPGVSVGNIESDEHYNQPYDGLVADLRLYDKPMMPAHAGFCKSLLSKLNSPSASSK